MNDHDRGDPIVQGYLQKLREVEIERLDLEAKLEISQAVADLCSHPSWNVLQTRLATLADKCIEALCAKEESPSYVQGGLKGRLYVARMLLRERPLDAQEVDDVNQKLSDLGRQIAEYQQLLL